MNTTFFQMRTCVFTMNKRTACILYKHTQTHTEMKNRQSELLIAMRRGYGSVHGI